MSLTAHWTDNPTLVDSAWWIFDNAVLDTGDRLGAVAPEWERHAYADTLGLPTAPSVIAGLDLVETCGPVGCGKDQIIALAALAFVILGPPGTQAVKQSTSKDKSKAVVDTAHGFIARARDAGLGENFIGVEIVRDEIRSVCPSCGKDRCLGSDKCAKDGAGSRLTKVVCTSLDGSSAVGVRASLFLMNEVQDFGYRGLPVYTHMFARFRKMGGRFICFTNAPYTKRGDWRRDRWEEAKRDGSDWYYRQISTEDCPWMADLVPLMRRNLSSQEFGRLFLCQPSDGRGELVTKEEMARCVMSDLGRPAGPRRPGRRFLGGDLATKRDHASLVVLCVAPDGAVFVERVDVWVPTKEQDIPLAEVKAKAREYLRDWKCEGAFDPHQAAQMVQELSAEGFNVSTVPFTQVNLVDMCSAVRELVRNNRLRLFPSAGHVDLGDGQSTDLVQQIVDAEVKKTERGERIVSQRSSVTGHGDQLSAFALAAMAAVQSALTTPAFGIAAPSVEKGPKRSVRGRARPVKELCQRMKRRLQGVA